MFGTNCDSSSAANLIGISTEDLDLNQKFVNANKSQTSPESDSQQQRHQSQPISFLRWINPFSSNSNNNNNNISNSSNNSNTSSDNNNPSNSNRQSSCKTPSLGSRSASSNCSSESEQQPSGDEYRGVQGLKQFWNSRISAIKDAKQKSATLGQIYSQRSFSSPANESTLSPSKSSTCLANDPSTRPFSFRDSFELPTDRHTEVDNFYKYKNAATTRKRISLSAASDLVFNRSVDRIVKRVPVKTNSFGQNFPAVVATPSGEKIHWARREDILMGLRAKQQQQSRNHHQSSVDSEESESNSRHAGELKEAESHIISNTTSAKDNSCTTTACNKHFNSDEMAINTKASETMERLPTQTADKTDSGRSHSGSTNSLSSDSPVRKTNLAATRKYSFKTHAKNYHTPRKMASVTASGSKVAALTHRFNQMVQQDSAILEEVKRNNGILMSVAGRVYKVKDGVELNKKRNMKRNSSDEDSSSTKSSAGKRKPSLKAKHSFSKTSRQVRETKSPGSVKATIEKFETKGDSPVRETNVASVTKKPKVPSKSEQVLQRTKEIAIRNSQKIKLVSTKMEKLSSGTNSAESATKILDQIQEEDKLPSEAKECLPEKTENQVPPPSSPMNRVEIQINLNEKPSEEFVVATPTPEPEEVESKKSRYARLYEKFRFRAKIAASKKSAANKSPPDKQPSAALGGQPEQKIIDALESVNKKLEHLSRSTNDLNGKKSDEERIYQEMAANMKPNESFLFRMNSKNISISAATINEEEPQEFVEAINTRLINKTQSMDETRFPSMLIHQIDLEEQSPERIFKITDELLEKFKTSSVEEDFYEPINPQADTQEQKPVDSVVGSLEAEIDAGLQSFLYKSLRKNKEVEHDKTPENIDVPNGDNNIYQTVAEAKATSKQRRDCDSLNSYESYENYESLDDDTHDFSGVKASTIGSDAPQILEDGYEICDPPEPPPPRKSEPDIRVTESVDPQHPNLPAPKRIIQNSSQLVYSRTAPPPPRPPKSPRAEGSASQDRSRLPDIPKQEERKSCSFDDDHESDDGENIYDTIKSNGAPSHCYESIHSKSHHQPKSLDTISMVSNCYESISSIRRMPHLTHSDSISTLASDQKTNSLYGMMIGGQNNTPPNGNASDNSEDWVDISDPDEEEDVENGGSKHQFIVVRERAKCHRSPVWSKRVRDQRLHQQNENQFDDDSDHYYEPLYTVEQTEQNLSSLTLQPEVISQHQNQHRHQPHQVPSLIMPDNQNNNYTQQSAVGTGNCYSDDYDSFDSDDDTDEDVKKNDSGVDISNARLPDPPPSTNQVYAFVKKIKNFGSLSKSLSKISKRKSSSSSTTTTPKTPENPGKPYENTQFYVNQEYQNTNYADMQPISKSGKQKTPKTSKKHTKPLQNTASDDPYVNTEFHTPRTPIIITSPEAESSPFSTPNLNQSDKSLPDSTGGVGITSGTDVMTRKKSKSGKSFKSKFRKSLGGPEPHLNIGSALNGTRSTFYISDSVDVDSGIFEKTPQSDSNLSQTPSETQLNPEQKAATVTRKAKKSLSSPELNRRKTTIGIRPNNPPPPPPIDKKSKQKRSSATTSWYAECGVFKASNLNDELLLKDGRRERCGSTSWYAEAGLYQTSGASVASSSGSSGVSTGGEGGPGDDNSHSMFLNEPLYQIYSAAKLESISRDIEDQESTDGYEEIGSMPRPNMERKPSRPTALQLVGPKQGPSRTLWSEIPEVINSEILSTLTPTEKRLQEAKFEILTSEASYLKSLNLLKSHFMNHPAFRDSSILSSSDRKTLFSYIVPVHECSDRLLCDLENCWQDNIMLLGLTKSIFKHAEKYFHVYVAFCEHQGKMDRTLRRLKEAKGQFSQTLEMLEADPVCYGLNLHSFLMLPMQRITRLPLLIDAVFSKVKPDDDEYDDWKMTLAILNKIVAQCNEAANRCEQAYEIERLSRQIEFPSNIRAFPIVPVGVTVPGKKPRALVKKGELTHLIWRGDDGKLTFGKKFVKCNIYVFLFTDLLVLTKRKSEEQFTVFDYSPRSMLTVSSGEVIPQLPTKEITQAGKNLILMTLLENHEGKTVELILSCPSVSEQQRWLQATAPPESENPDEKLYEQWDCPQVIAKHEYCANEPDLLSLEPGDVVNVTRKMADGWYQGERIRDGATGWFPGNYTEEVNSPHVRARNLKQRYRLLTLTASYLEAKKRK